MTDERFNELLNGPLHHPLVPFVISRLALALRSVVEATGAAGEKALESYCAARQAQDEATDEDYPDEDSGLPPAFEPEDVEP